MSHISTHFSPSRMVDAPFHWQIQSGLSASWNIHSGHRLPHVLDVVLILLQHCSSESEEVRHPFLWTMKWPVVNLTVALVVTGKKRGCRLAKSIRLKRTVFCWPTDFSKCNGIEISAPHTATTGRDSGWISANVVPGLCGDRFHVLPGINREKDTCSQVYYLGSKENGFWLVMPGFRIWYFSILRVNVFSDKCLMPAHGLVSTNLMRTFFRKALWQRPDRKRDTLSFLDANTEKAFVVQAGMFVSVCPWSKDVHTWITPAIVVHQNTLLVWWILSIRCWGTQWERFLPVLHIIRHRRYTSSKESVHGRFRSQLLCWITVLLVSAWSAIIVDKPHGQ